MQEHARLDNAQIVIVGAGQAGAACARALRDYGFSGKLSLFGDEPYAPYERPPLSKAILSGTAEDASSECLSLADAGRLNIEMHLGRQIAAIAPLSKRMLSADGNAYPYDRLVLATGGRARTLPGLVPDQQRIFVVRSRSDAVALRAALAVRNDIFILGGGWLGLEIAATVRTMGHAVTLVESAERLCARSVPSDISEELRQLHLDNGVRLSLGRMATPVPGAGALPALKLDDGTLLSGDILVVAIGLVPETGLAERAGLAVSDGIIVDTCCRTSDPFIYAIGDCARSAADDGGQLERVESWQNANVQAEVVARALTGKPSAPRPLPWFWSEQYDTMVQLLGDTGAHRRTVRRGAAPAPHSYLYLDDTRLVGIVAFSNPKDIGIARRLIAEGTRLDVSLAAMPHIPLARAVKAEP